MGHKITRSKSVNLVKMGKVRAKPVGATVVSLSALALAACSQQPAVDNTPIETGLFDTVEKCEMHYQKFGPQEEIARCEEGRAQALAQHLAVSPKFQTLEECEVAHGEGQCEIEQSDEPRYSPVFAGFWIGRTFDDQSRYRSQPVYKTADGRFMTGGNKPFMLTDLTGRYTVTPAAWSRPETTSINTTKTARGVLAAQERRETERRTRTASRGGFGRSFFGSTRGG
ncbi:MAG: DUF1190 domain-containing protein [Pseudomonadota bacterium]